MSHRIIGDNAVDPFIFREYIGVKPYPASLNNFPSEIIIARQFHFILGFAKDTYEEGKGTGRFTPCWNNDFFCPQHVEDLKRNYPHVKVVISIGGRVADCPFFPAATEEWCRNAVVSLKEIIRSYNDSVKDIILIDGIDINYVTVKSSDTDFSYCIGKVIKGLKQDVNVNVVSIAPSLPSQSPYKTLYSDMADDIDYVDYQFYIQNINLKDEFIKLFRNLLHVYPLNKILAGASSDPIDADNFNQDEFVEACIYLLKTKSLRGIFIWNANDSANDVPPFKLDKRLQKIISNN